MTVLRGAMLAAALVLAGPVRAAPPEVSPRPLPRPQAAALSVATLSPPAAAWAGASRPRPRPQPPQAAAALPPSAEPPSAAAAAVPAGAQPPEDALPRPAPRPERLIPAAAVRARPGPTPARPERGALCGVAGLQGERLAPITARVQGCGVGDPVRVTAVGGVRLSMPATMDCDTAHALAAWVDRGLKPAFARQGVAELQVAAHYACRSRNNQAGARISEHGRGRAIDISAITLASGKTLTVLNDWRSSKALRTAYKAACGPFGTTLGPNADRHHRDHMHFDTARHRSGAYCR